MSAAKAIMYLVPQYSELINYLNISMNLRLIQKLNQYNYIHWTGTKYELLCLIMSIIDSLRNNGVDLLLILEGMNINQNDYFDYSNFCKDDIKNIDIVKDNIN